MNAAQSPTRRGRKQVIGQSEPASQLISERLETDI